MTENEVEVVSASIIVNFGDSVVSILPVGFLCGTRQQYGNDDNRCAIFVFIPMGTQLDGN